MGGDLFPCMCGVVWFDFEFVVELISVNAEDFHVWKELGVWKIYKKRKRVGECEHDLVWTLTVTLTKEGLFWIWKNHVCLGRRGFLRGWIGRFFLDKTSFLPTSTPIKS